MALYKFTRSPFECARFSEWWRLALDVYGANDLGKYLRFLADPGKPEPEWVCTDISYSSALKMMKMIPDWEGPDGFGHPLIGLRLSPREEHEALVGISPELRAQFAPECMCPPNAPRRLRRMADAAWKKYVRDRERAYEAAQRSASGVSQ